MLERGSSGAGNGRQVLGALWVRHELLGPGKGFKLRGDYMAFFSQVLLLGGRRRVSKPLGQKNDPW